MENVFSMWSSTLVGAFAITCKISGVVWGQWGGQFTLDVLSRIGQALFDPTILATLNAECSFNCIAFSCGTVLNLQTLTPEPGQDIMFIRKTTEYRYPKQEVQDLEQELQAAGLGVCDLL